MSEIERYADKAMYEAAPMYTDAPRVYLLSMTADPLGVIAAACMMYEGKVVTNLDQVTIEDRKHYWKQVQATKLKAPLEFVYLHFMLEGVTRSFTHQMVRQRTAVYAQESLRFAVKENMKEEIPYPPSLQDPGLSPSERNTRQDVWDEAIAGIDRAYKALIANGVPAEDARGLLPHQTTTRLHYATNLRNLVEHAGNRLCTQAQFEWREVFLGASGLVNAIRGYDPSTKGDVWGTTDRWQFEMITDDLFVPACYQAGKCPFQADFDRGCTIRDRVDANAAIGRPSSEWALPLPSRGIDPIRREEWLDDPKAAWVE